MNRQYQNVSLICLYLLNLYFTINGDRDEIYLIKESDTQNECYERIYRGCNHKTHFSDEEIENVTQYIQNKFLTESNIKPIKPACSKLYVRREFKCLTHEEKMSVVNVFKKLFENGVMHRLSTIHAKYWTEVHKGNEAGLFHRWLLNELEKEMRKFEANMTLPYWQTPTEFAEPEKSIIWEYFGHAGNKENGYCISDGLFANQTIYSGSTQCLKRQWTHNIKPSSCLGAPEWETALLHISKDSWLYFNILFTNPHFKTHFAIGGYAGDMSLPIAPNDPLFYLFHGYNADYLLFKWQLIESNHLVPQSYNFGFRLDSITKKVVISNIEKDFLTYYSNISVVEAFQVGFGELCYVHDQHIIAINKILNNEKSEIPISIQRLPQHILNKYYPDFTSSDVSALNHMFVDVGDCNKNLLEHKCKPMQILPSFLSTANGRRQMRKFLPDFTYKIDTSMAALYSDAVYYQFMAELIKAGYCSPYV